MEILTFDMAGKFAHFRKYYANNTAMSFTLPPRTALMGIVGAILGLPRDSYYKALASEHFRFSVRILGPVKKSFHRLNMIKIIGERDFQGKQGHTQTPFEVVTGPDLRKDQVQYRIYIAVDDPTGNALYGQLKSHLLAAKAVFSVSMGTANFSAQISNIRIYPPGEWVRKETLGKEFLAVHSAVPSVQVQGVDGESGKMLLEEERLPANFRADFSRELAEPMWRILFSTNGKPMRLKLRGNYFELHKAGDTEIITFLD
ncbi:MAG TPA: CRISPR-associated protein Cas5 [Flavilitoribacter sp.]|nr:CRISPR-associated protein Cas5 [Flavilitoribacter sp.]HMQ87052.1 CRISPR-associated protein Cas5 [Flavilitoribacter sp.]